MLYLVTVLRTAHFQQTAIAPHQTFLQGLRQAGFLQLAGPFTDQSGGAYLLQAESLSAAIALVQQDPLVLTGSSELKVYEWQAS